MRKTRTRIAALCGTAALSIGAFAAPAAEAQPNVVGTAGLVNVVIVDAVDVEDNTVQVPVGVAAALCDINAAVLIAAIEDEGDATCTATADAAADAPGQGRP